MILIILYHSIILWTGRWAGMEPAFSAPALGWIAEWMNSFHVYAFTLVSGYLFSFLKYEKKKYGEFVPFLKNKAKRLLLPYGFICIVWVIPVSACFGQLGWKDVFFDYILGTAPSQLWFLLMLFDIFLLFWLLADFFEKHDVLGAIVVLALYGVSIVGGKLLPNVFMVWSACAFSPVFWIGMKLRQRGSKWIRKIPALVWLAVDIGLFLLIKFVLIGEGLLFTLLFMGCTFLLRCIGAVMAFVCLQKLADVLSYRTESKGLALLGKTSMPMYLIHQQWIYISIAIFNGVLNPYLHGVVNFMFAGGISLLISLILMKFKATRFLIGEK